MRVGGVFVAHKGGFEMLRSGLVFAASIKGQAERDVRGRESRITLQCLGVSLARFTFSTLLIEREAGDVALLLAVGGGRCGNRARRGFEIRIVVDRRISSIPQQHAGGSIFE